MNQDTNIVRPVATEGERPLIDFRWRARSADELRAIIAHGANDDDFPDAARELERRAREMTDAADAAKAEGVRGQRIFARYLVGGLLAVAVLGLVIGLFAI